MGADGTDVTPEELTRFATTLRESTNEVDQAAQTTPPALRAGKSTPLIEESTSVLLKAIAGLTDGVQRTADAVDAGKTNYVSNEDEISANLDKLTGQLGEGK